MEQIFDAQSWIDELNSSEEASKLKGGSNKQLPQKKESAQFIKIQAKYDKYHGSLSFLPFPDKTGQFKIDMVDKFKAVENDNGKKVRKRINNSVRTIKINRTYNDKGETKIYPAEYKILPKNLLGKLTEDESDLYDKVVKLYDFCMDDKNKIQTNKKMSRKNVTLLSGILLKYFNSQQKPISEYKLLEPFTLYVSSKDLPSLILNDIKTMGANINPEAPNDLSWTSHWYNNRLNNRRCYISITAKDAAIGLDLTFNHLENSELTKVVPVNLDLTEVAGKMPDMLRDYLSFNYDLENNKYFNATHYHKILEVLEGMINEKQSAVTNHTNIASPESITTNSGVVDNKIIVDPLKNESIDDLNIGVLKEDEDDEGRIDLNVPGTDIDAEFIGDDLPF